MASGTFPGFSSEDLRQIKNQALYFWDFSTKYMRSFFDDTNDRERMARCLLPEVIERAYKEHPEYSCLAPPDFFVNIKSLQAAIAALVFGSKPYGRLSLLGAPNDLTDHIHRAEAVLQEMNDVGRDEDVLEKAFHQALYAGTSATYTKWYRMPARVALRDPGSGELVTDPSTGKVVFQDEIIAEFAKVVPIDIRRVRIDPSCDEMADRRLVAHQSLQRYTDILFYMNMPQYEHFYNFDATDLLKSSFPVEKYFEFVHAESDQYGDKGEQNAKDYSDPAVEVLEFRGIFQLKQSDGSIRFEDLIVHIGNRDILLGVKANDLPINGWEIYDFPQIDQEHGRLFPMGVVEPAEDTWLELFMKHNQSLDRSNRRIHDVFVGDASACQELPDYIPFEPDKLITIDLASSGTDDVRKVFSPLIRSNHPDNTFEHALTLSQSVQKIMRLSDYIQGMDPKRAETATAVEALMRSGQTLLIQLANRLKETLLEPVWRKKLIYYKHFKGHLENQLYDWGGEKIKIQKNELASMYRIDIDIASNQERPTMVRRFVEMWPQLSVDPYFDQYELRKIATRVLKLPGADKILIDNTYISFQAHRESIALAEGVQLPVDPRDKHDVHIEIHQQWLQRKDTPVNIEVLTAHIEEHAKAVAEQNQGVGNTKEGGGLANSTGAAMTKGTGVGQGLKAAGRV